MNTTLTVKVKRPIIQNEHKVAYVEWLIKVRNNHYCNNSKVEKSLNRIL